MNTRCATDIDNGPLLAVFNHEVWRGFSDQSERSGVMDAHHCRDLLVCEFVDGAVPGVACIVHYDVDFAISEFRGLRDQYRRVRGVGDVAGDANGTIGRGGVNRFRDSVGFCGINVADNNPGPFICKKTSSLRPDALTRTCDLDI